MTTLPLNYFVFPSPKLNFKIFNLKMLIYGVFYLVVLSGCNETAIVPEPPTQAEPGPARLKSAVISTNYYVAKNGKDSNTGTIAFPFLTIQKAANIVNPGDSVIVNDGVYISHLDAAALLHISRGGTSDYPVVFKSKNKYGAVLDGEEMGGYGIDLSNNASYVKIQDFEIKNFRYSGIDCNAQYPAGVTAPCNYITVEGNKIHAIGRYASTNDTGLSGIYFRMGNHHWNITRNFIYDIGRTGPDYYWMNKDHAIYIGSSDTPEHAAHHNTVSYNVIWGCSGVAITNGGNNDSFVNNVFAWSNENSLGGSPFIAPDPDVADLLIANNIFFQPPANNLYALSNLGNIIRWTIKNNIVYGGSMWKPSNYGAAQKASMAGDNYGKNDCENGEVDPKFVNAFRANVPNVDFRLQSTSPAINAGADVGQIMDMQGIPIGGQQIIGAYKYAGSDPPSTIYYNAEISASITKKNCATGYKGSLVTYSVEAKKYSSAISQADADSKALADLYNNKQAYADANGTCTLISSTPVYYNSQVSATATKNDCGTGYTSSTVTYTVPASKYSSTVSQADADAKATADLDANKQTYANANGTCTVIPQTPVYYNAEVSATITKKNCATGYKGSLVTYSVEAEKYSSTVSQADADNKALTDLYNNKQAYADANGTCTLISSTAVYYNSQVSATATKNDCGTGYSGSTVSYTVSASKYSSTVSQTDADAKATADLNANKQPYANANGTCTVIPQTPVYYNTEVSATITKKNCATGYKGSLVTYSVAAKKYSSTISQADADNKALTDLYNNKQAYADANGTCTLISSTAVYYNSQVSATVTKKNCESGYNGSLVTYSVAANKYSSTVSQADADNKALVDLYNNKQAYADANGTCPTVYYNSEVSATITKKSCGTGYIGSLVTYSVEAKKYSSIVSKVDADNKALADLYKNKQAYADANGTCIMQY